MSMRRMFGAVAALALVVPATAMAQGGHGFSVKGGLVTSNFGGSDSEGFDGRTGFVAGGAIRFNRSAVLTIQPEILYVQKGADEVSIDYIEIPILFKFEIPLEILDPYAVAGPYGAFAISCDISGFDGCDDAGVESFDYGLALGAGVRLGGTSGLGFEIRYDWGFADVPDTDFDVDLKNQAWMFLVSFDF